MGIFTRNRRNATTAAPIVDPSTLPIGSPWSAGSNLQRIVVEDIWGTNVPVNTRGAAMRIPAVARARNLIVSSLCQFPLVARRGEAAAVTPRWMLDTGDGSTPQHRLAWTVDDLLFYGWSVWWRTNDPETGFPVAAARVNVDDWRINEDNRIEVDGSPVRDSDVIVIPGLHEGLLTYGVDALEDTRALYEIVRTRLNNPVPQLDLHQTGGAQLTEDEIDTMIDRWATARRGEHGGVAYTSEHIEVRELGAADAQLMIEARNAASLDLARAVGVTAGLIDATAPKASLNYETTTGRNTEFVDRDLLLYMTPITARLSLDDVMPPGERAAFDVAGFTDPAPAGTGPNLED